MKNAWDTAQNMLNSGKSKEEILRRVCESKGINEADVKSLLSKNGINL